MFKIVFLNLLLLYPVLSFSQEEILSKKEQRSLAKEERKARRAAEEEQMKNMTRFLLEQKRFVMEAEYISDSRGVRRPVNSTLNFIIVDSTEGTIQLSTLSGPGYNGVGGITVEGTITKAELDTIRSKSGTSYNFKVIMLTSMGTFDIFFMISPMGYADATIQGTTRGMLRYNGSLVPIGKSRTYKGTSSF